MQERSGLKNALILSLLLHILLFLVWNSPLFSPSTPPVKHTETLIELEPTERSKRAVVQTAPGNLTKTPPKDAFLSAQNQKVDRQTVNHIQKFSKATGGSKSLQTQPQPFTLSSFGVTLPKAMPKNEQNTLGQEAGPRPEDYVRGIEESDRTALNTQEFVYYGYFQRIRERLDQAWNPILRQRLASLYQAGRRIASDTDHTTRVVVVLNEQGAITRVQVLGESGIKDLDESAISAFNRAGPFPNPPKGMIDANGEIKIPWDFILRT